ncbi:MAG: ATP-binding protein [Geobacteraceae bacterium]
MNTTGLFTILRTKAMGSFATKIFLAQAFSVLILSLVFTGYFIHRERRGMTEILQGKGTLLAQQLADTGRIGVFAESPELLAEPMRAIIEQKEVLQARVFNLEGNLISARNAASTDTPENGSPQNRPGNALPSPKPETPLTISNTGTIEFWAPIQSAPLFSPEEALIYTDNPEPNGDNIVGYAAVTLDTSRLDTTYRGLIWKSVSLCLAFLAVALWFAYRIAHGITRPLNSLKERVNALGKGKAVESIPVETNDEIGELSAAFNIMAKSLQVREKEKEHLEAMLRQAQKMEAIGQLAGGVAHDFNNILCAIIGFGTLLEMSMEKDDPARRHLDQILSAADRATSLTQGLLTFSRKQILNPHPVSLNAIVHRIEKMLNRLLTEDIELRLSLAGQDLNVLVDSGQIDQVLLNLATNARDAMPNGGLLTITTGEADPPAEFLAATASLPTTRYALLTVSDSGSGIEEETREKIFEPFFTTKEVGKGTGLGLSVVYGIVKQHNGHILVNSEPGKGTSFLIYLPMTPKDNLPPKIVDIPALPVAGKETLLVVEDNPEVLNLNRTVLETFGYGIIEAVNGEDAIEQFNRYQQNIDLIIMDVVMPKMNGKQAYLEIAKLRPDVKILFMSGYTADIVMEKGLSIDDFNFMHKPATPMELLRRIREILDA